MATQNWDKFVDDVDAHLAADKYLDGPIPQWKEGDVRKWRLNWNVIESASGASNSYVCINYVEKRRNCPSVLLIYSDQNVWRYDMEKPDTIKRNPEDAEKYELPPEFNGQHEHAWKDNRDFVLKNGPAQLPYRRPLPQQIKRFDQCFLDFLGRTKISIASDQWGLTLPPDTS